MKALFLVFHGFGQHNGISKKIFYQIDALKTCGVDVELCYMNVDADEHRKRMIDNKVLEDYGSGFLGKLRKRIRYARLFQHVVNKDIKFVYVRHDHNANPFLIHFFRKLKRQGVIVLLEIPTYPYDHEYRKKKRRIFFDRHFRNRLAKYTSRIVTFSDDDVIFGIPTLKISNGIDFGQIKMKTHVNDISKQINLLGVAEIHFWHGFDRVITGLAKYYEHSQSIKVFFHIVGEGATEKLKQLVTECSLEQYVIFHGKKSGDALDEQFENADMGIASLARHRSHITKIKTLKNREYAARGIPFIYSEIDDDFENMPYIMKAPADESPIDIKKIVDFRISNNVRPEEIRNSILYKLSWTEQMKIIVDFVNSQLTKK